MKMFIRSTVSYFDLFAVNPSLRFKEKSYSGTLCLGIFSCILLILFAILLISRLDASFNFSTNQINFSYYQKRTSQGVQIKDFMFGVSFDIDKNISVTQYQNYFTMYIQYWDQENQQNKIELLKPCEPIQWVTLGQNYTQQFYQNFIHQSYCPQKPLNISIKDIDTNLLKFTFTQCSSSYNKNCLPQSQVSNLFKIMKQNGQNYFSIYLKFLASTVIITNKMPVSRYIKQQQINYFPFNRSLGYINNKVYAYFQAERFEIQQKDSLLSVLQRGQSFSGLTIKKSHLVPEVINRKISQQIKYLQLYININQNIQSYNRSKSTIDDIISYCGGLFEIVFGFLIFFLGYYSEMKYQLTVAGSYFNLNSDGKKIKRKDLNFWSYLKYGVYNFIQSLCCFQPSTQIKQMVETLQESNKLMDVKNLFRRLDILERIVDIEVGSNELKSLSILKPPCLREVQQKRIIMNYYKTIVKLQQAASVQDAIAERSSSFKYLSKPKSILQLNYRSENNNQVNLEAFKQKQQIYFSLIKDLKLDNKSSKCISQHLTISNDAKQIILPLKQEEIENRITNCFLNLDQDEKKEIMMKIPIKILHRLRLKAAQSNKLTCQSRVNEKEEIKSQQYHFPKQQHYPIKKRIREGLKQFFSYFDIFSIEPLLRTDQSPDKSTSWFGFLNFLLLIVFGSILINIILQLFKLDSNQLIISDYKDVQKGKKSISNIMVAVKFPNNRIINDSQGVQNFKGLFRFIIHFSNSSEYLVRCKPQMWSLIGQDYYEHFARQKLEEAYCIQNLLNFTNFEQNYRLFQLNFYGCLSNKFMCQIQKIYYKQVIKQFKHFPIWLYHLTTEIEASSPDPAKYYIRMVRLALPEAGKRGVYREQFRGIKIITDNSVWPLIEDKKQATYYTPEPIIPDGFSDYSQLNCIVNYYFSSDLTIFQRKVNKIDEAFSYIGGLFGFVVLFFNFFFQSYNEYRYQLSVGESSFNFESNGNKFSEKKLNSLIYIKYSIFKWIKQLLCFEPQWKNIQKMNQTLEEVSEFLDVQKLFKRLEFLERVIWKHFDKSFLVIMALSELSSLAEIHRKRAVLQYYDEVIQQNPAASVEDAVNQTIQPLSQIKHSKTMEEFRLQSQYSMFQKRNNLKQFSQQSMVKDQIKQSFIRELGLSQKVSSVLSEHLEIKQEAQQILLNQKFSQVQIQMALAFRSLSPQKKEEIIMKIPIILLHRLRMKIKQRRIQSEQFLQTEENRLDESSFTVSGSENLKQNKGFSVMKKIQQ